MTTPTPVLLDADGKPFTHLENVEAAIEAERRRRCLSDYDVDIVPLHAGMALHAVEEHQSFDCGHTCRQQLSDLVTDLRHLSDVLGLDWDEVISCAYDCYSDEASGETAP